MADLKLELVVLPVTDIDRARAKHLANDVKRGGDKLLRCLWGSGVRLDHLAAEKAARRCGFTKLLRTPGSWKNENAFSFGRLDRERSLLN